MRLRVILGAVLALGLVALRYPAGVRTAATDTAWGLGALGLAVLLGFIGWGVRTEVVRRRSEAARRALPAVSSGPDGRMFLPERPDGWPTSAPPCSAGCGRPSEVRMSWSDGRPDEELCRPCWRDTAASESAAARPLAPDDRPGTIDMSEFENR